MARTAHMAIVSITDEHGKPARLDDIRWEFKLNNFVSALKKHTPVGTHEHDQVSTPYSATATKDGRALPRIPGEQGSLAKHWKLSKRASGGVSLWKSKGKAAGISIRSDKPHANIIDVGGTIRAKLGSWMHWHQGGHDIRTRFRRGFTIKPAHYVEKAVDEFLSAVSNVKVEWA